MAHPIAPGFVSETEIRTIATLINVNRYPTDHVLMSWDNGCRLTAGDLRRLCTTAMIGARLVDASADFAFAYGFSEAQREPAKTA